MRTRLCLFTASPEPSGVGEHMLTLAAGLRDHYVVSFVCPAYKGGRNGTDTRTGDGAGHTRARH